MLRLKVPERGAIVFLGSEIQLSGCVERSAKVCVCCLGSHVVTILRLVCRHDDLFLKRVSLACSG